MPDLNTDLSGDEHPDDVGISPYDDFDRDLNDPSLYLNRELSELAFQRRVLHEALDDGNPLLERVRFLSIVTRNLDEFAMKRVGGLKQQIQAGITETTADGRTPDEQWRAVHRTLSPMLADQRDCYREMLRPALREAGIHILEYNELTDDEQSRMDAYFQESVFPTLTPLAFTPAHPFPFISNRSLSLAVLTEQPDEEEPTFTRIKIPPNRPRLVAVEEGSRYVLIEEIIRANLGELLPNVDIVDTALFRLTRNAEVRRNEEVAEDLIEMIEEVLEQRRFATVVRLEIEDDPNPAILGTLRRQLDLDDREIYELGGPLDYRGFASLTDLDLPELKLESWTPQPHPRLAASPELPVDPTEGEAGTDSVFERIDEDDILLHHPYHDFDQTVQRFLSEAAEDPDVLAVKAAIYRTASDSQVIQSLIDAAENGKQVAVMVELKARFDEQNNLEWVRRLEENGIHVAYGTIGLKTHTKTALVVRDGPDGVRLYSHVGTGNYHSETAKGYVDLGLLTADREIGRDIATLFNAFTGPALNEEFRRLLVAPVTMRKRIVRYIRREAQHAQAGRSARIVIKVNGLEDPDIVEELYRASMAGVEIDLIVRDICRLRPGLEEVSETISVHSIVGRFLEHSRIFHFENGGDPEYYIGSADLMTRNLDSRVEAVAPVDDPHVRRQLKFNLELALADNRKRWTMNPDGSYDKQVPGEDPVVEMQSVLMREAEKAAEQDGAIELLADHPSDVDLLVEPTERHERDDTEQDEAVAEARASGSELDSRDAGETEAADVRANADEESSRSSVGTENEPVPDGTGDRSESLNRHDGSWYVPDSDRYRYAVRTPEGETRYLKTEEGAAELLERLYG